MNDRLDFETLVAMVAAARRLAADLATYNPGHGDFRIAAKRLTEVLDQAADDA